MSDAIVGYVFRAAQYCPSCARKAVYADPVFDGWALADGAAPMSVEEDLSEIAGAFGVNRYDESSFDSGDFPKVITRQMAETDAGWGADMSCGNCYIDILEEAADR